MEDFDEAAWQKWVAERPPVVRAIAERLRPDMLYQLRTTGQRVTLESINEGGTITVGVYVQFNPGMLPPNLAVFGVDPNDLEEIKETVQ